MTSPGKRFSTLPKDCFPSKLKALVEELNHENLIAGFKACGLVPLNRHEVLKRLPKTPIAINDSNNAINNVIIEHLQALIGSKDTAGPSRRPRRKLNVVAGRSVGEDRDTDKSRLSTQKVSTAFYLSDSWGKVSVCCEFYEYQSHRMHLYLSEQLTKQQQVK